MSTAEVIQMTPRSDRREAIAAPIRAHLAVSKISGADLARRIGLTQPQVSRRLSGRLPFTSDDLTAIADELNLTVAELVQMPQRGTIGGGTSFVGVTPIRPRLVGRTGLEPVTDGSWVAREVASLDDYRTARNLAADPSLETQPAEVRDWATGTR